MSELVDWLSAQLDADEAAARKLAETVGADWWVDGPAENSGRWWIYDLGVKFGSKHEADFVASHSPARVLVEVEAKRAIVALHREDDFAGCVECGKAWRAVNRGGVGPERGCPTLRALALPYADAPGYDERWRP